MTTPLIVTILVASTNFLTAVTGLIVAARAHKTVNRDVKPAVSDLAGATAEPAVARRVRRKLANGGSGDAGPPPAPPP